MTLARNTISGAVDDVPQNLIDHATLGQYLEIVPEGTKPFTPGHFKQGTVAERAEAAAEKAKATAAKPKEKDNK